ncbi:hypothetical protein FS837_003162, partial [Tulasnella sp. UAMH 9824]
MSEAEDEEFEVQVVQEAEYRPLDGDDKPETMCYLVRWWGYGAEDDTWEPEGNFDGPGSKALLDRFWRSVGVNRMEASLNDRYIASGSWIGQEMRNFEKEKQRMEFGALGQVDEDEDLEKKPPPKEPKPKKGKKNKEAKPERVVKAKPKKPSVEPKEEEKKKGKEKAKPNKGGAFDIDLDDSPKKPSKKEKPTKGTSTSKRSRITSPSDESEDDVPLAASVPPKKKKRSARQNPVAGTSKAGAKQQSGPLFRSSSPEAGAQDPEEFFQSITPAIASPAATTKQRQKTKSKSSTPVQPSTSLPAKDPPPVTRKEPEQPLLGEAGPSKPRVTPESVDSQRPPVSRPLSTQSRAVISADAPAPGPIVDKMTAGSPTAMDIVLPEPKLTSGPVEAPAPLIPEPPRKQDIVVPTPGVNKHRGSRLKMLSDKSDAVKAVPPDAPSVRRQIGGKFVKVTLKPEAVKPKSSGGSNVPAHSPNSPERSRPIPSSIGSVAPAVSPPAGDSARPLASSHSPTTEQHWAPNNWSDGQMVMSPVQDMVLDNIADMIDDAFANPGAGASGPSKLSTKETVSTAAPAVEPPSETFLRTLFDPAPQATTTVQAVWSGSLQLPTGSDASYDLHVALGDVVSEPSAPPVEVMVSGPAIHLNGLYSTDVFLQFIQPAFGAPSHFAVLQATVEMETARLQRLVTFLRDTNQVSISFLKASGGTAKSPYMMVVFPSEYTTLRQSFAIPRTHANRPDALLAAIVKQLHPVGFSVTRPASPVSSVVREEPLWLQQATSLLGLTPEHNDRFKGATFAFYPDDRAHDMDYDAKAFETYLIKVLGGTRVPHSSADAKFIFIHAKGRRRLDRLHNLQERRREAPQIAFYAYGWDVGIDPQKANVRSIWEIGGIMAFTPKAIVEHPEKVRKILDEAQDDPFWEIYLTPGVIALADELSTLQDDGSSSAKEALHSLLPLFSKGKRHRANVTLGMPSSDIDPIIWAYNQMKISERSMVEILDDCAVTFQEKYSSMVAAVASTPSSSTTASKTLLDRATTSEISEVEKAVEKELITDLQLLQLKPELAMYRRCVLVVSDHQHRPKNVP